MANAPRRWLTALWWAIGALAAVAVAGLMLVLSVAALQGNPWALVALLILWGGVCTAVSQVFQVEAIGFSLRLRARVLDKDEDKP